MRKAFICPTKYVQGEDELLNLGYFVKTFGDSALLIANPDDVTRVQAKLDATAEKFGVKFVLSNFRGQCSRQEVAPLPEGAQENNCARPHRPGGGDPGPSKIFFMVGGNSNPRRSNSVTQSKKGPPVTERIWLVQTALCSNAAPMMPASLPSSARTIFGSLPAWRG